MQTKKYCKKPKGSYGRVAKISKVRNAQLYNLNNGITELVLIRSRIITSHNTVASIYISTVWKQPNDFYNKLDFDNWINPDFHN